jgi:hypothetical protein
MSKAKFDTRAEYKRLKAIGDAERGFDFEAAWDHLMAIKEGESCYGFDQFFFDKDVKVVAKYLLAEGQRKGVFALYCEDFFVEEIDTKNITEAKKCFLAVLNDIQARRGEWK